MSRAKKPTPKYTKEGIQKILAENPRALARAIIAIYRRQTASEQASGVTKEDNGVGFTGVDAYLMSSFAVQLQQGWSLSQKQAAIALKRMPKYWRQLIEVAKDKDARREAAIAQAAILYVAVKNGEAVAP